MKLPKILKVLLVSIIFINSALATTFAEEETVTTETTIPQKPELKMSGTNTYSIEAGASSQVTIPIVNTSQDMALDVLIKATPGEDSPLSVSFLNSSDRASTILRGGSHTVSLSINVEKNATTGRYPIRLDYYFTSSDNQSFTGSDTFYVKVDSGSLVPTVALNNLKVSKDTVALGERFSVTGSLENISGIEASNVRLELISLEESNLSVVGGKSSVYYSKMAAGASQNASFDLETTTLTKDGSNKITLKLTYTDNAGKEYTKDYYTYVTVSKTGSVTGADLKITSLTAPTGTFNVGQSGTFNIKIKNQSSTEAKGVKVSTKLPENIVPTSNNTILIESILPNEEKQLSFSVAPTSSATTQTYSIGFSVEFANSSTTNTEGNTTSNNIVIEQYAGFNVNNPKAATNEDGTEKTSVPKIIVSKYESNPTIVEAGKSFTLSMNFENTHPTKTVKNIKIYLTVNDQTEKQGSVFAPDNSSTTYFIDSIAPKQEVTHTFNLYAVPDASPRSYTVNVNLEYEDEQANEYKSTELVGVNVKQQANLELSDISEISMATVNNPVNVSFQLYNTGKVTLSNLMVKLEGEAFDTSSATNFIGNFTSGATEYYDGMVIPLQTGEQTLKLLITYNDTDGTEVEKTQEIKINVEEEFIPEDFGTDIAPEETDSGISGKTIAIIIAVVVVIGVVIFIIVKKAKAKKELDFND